MMLITGNDQFPQTAGVLVLRWVWRYRSELTPLYAAGTVLGVASWLHAGHRHWWVLVLAIAAMTAAALAAFGGRAWLPTLVERLYAAVTALAVGGWMAAAAIVGPFTTPMPSSWPSGEWSWRCPGGLMPAAAPGSASSASSKPGRRSPRRSG